jgi:hypothetical protein
MPLTQEEITQIPDEIKEEFYQSFLEKNNEKMSEMIEKYGIEVCYFTAQSTSQDEGCNYKIENADTISRHAVLGDSKNVKPDRYYFKYNFDIDCCKNFLKMLNHDQRMAIISSINLRAFLDTESIESKLNEIVSEEYSDHTFENEDLKKKFVENALGQYLKPENISLDNPLYGGGGDSEFNIIRKFNALELLVSIENLFESKDVTEILTASNSDGNFLFNIIFDDLEPEDSSFTSTRYFFEQRSESVSLNHLLAQDSSYFEGEKKSEMRKLIRYLYMGFHVPINKNYNLNFFINIVDGQNKVPIQLALENANFDFLSILIDFVEDECIGIYNSLLEQSEFWKEKVYNDNLIRFFGIKVQDAIEEINKINTQLPADTDIEKKLKQLEIFNVIYGLFRIALLTNDSDTQITIIQNIIDVIEDQKLIDYPEVNFTENDIFTKISVFYFNYRNVVSASIKTYEKVKTIFDDDSPYYDLEIKQNILQQFIDYESDKFPQSLKLYELLKEALPQRSTYLASKGDYEKVAIYYFKNISKILEENSGTLLRSPDPALIKQDAMDPRLVVFSTPMYNIFRNFPDLEKGKEEFQSSLMKYAEETNAIKVLAIFTGGVIEKVYEKIKQERDLKSNPQQAQIQEQATLSSQNVVQTNLSSNPQDSGPSQAIASSTILSQQLSSNQSLLGKRTRAGSCPL